MEPALRGAPVEWAPEEGPRREENISQLKSRIFASPLEGRPHAFHAVPPAWRVDARGNIVGGILAALVSLTLSMGLGALAFAPFGPEYAARGVLAGLYSAAFLGLVAVLVGARGVAIYAPRSLVSFMGASVAADLFMGAKWLPPDPDSVTAAIFLLLALSGAFQLLFGLVRFARVVKFIPTPVMAGFQNAASMIILLSQTPTLLGLERAPALADWPSTVLAQAHPLGLLVGIATLAFILRPPRAARHFPPLVLGLVVGLALCALAAIAGLGEQLGPRLGAIPAHLPDGHELATIMVLTTVPGFWAAFPAMVLGAATIAVVTSLDVLINAKIVEHLTRRRGNATQELISIGAANLVTPLLGGIAGSISLGTTATAIKGGARNSLALLVHSLLFLLLVPLIAPALAYVPRVVIAALVFYAGIMLFDRWTLQLAWRAVARQAIHWPSIYVDLCVITLVTAVAVSGRIIWAVLLGVAVALVVFTLRMSRGVIRREQYGDVVQSRRARDLADAQALAASGHEILAIELEGPLFFASAEMLHNRVDAAIAEGVRYVILDVARVTELDSTGARILLQADDRLRTAKCRMLLCGASVRPGFAALLADHGVAAALTRERIFPDLDRALEWCENDVLAGSGPSDPAGEQAFERLDLIREIDPADRAVVREALDRREYRPGEAVFRQGEEGDALYVIAHGSASVWLRDPDAGERRLMTFSQGTFFGEMALLDRERRSATVMADEPLVCYVLEREKFDRLVVECPRAALALLTALAREISLRMRRANRTLLELA